MSRVRRGVIAIAVPALACSQASPALPTAKTSCELPPSQVHVFASARWLPEYENGVLRGVAMTQVAAGSFLACLGLRDGDLLVEIDDTPVAQPADFGKLGKQRKQSVVVEDAAGARRRIVNE